jgi:hypothetical protein
MAIKDKDIMDMLKWFEDTLSRISKINRKEKMKMRKKIRDELYLLLTWEKPTPDIIMNRWEERLDKIFSVMPFGAKEELLKLMKKKMEMPKI